MPGMINKLKAPPIKKLIKRFTHQKENRILKDRFEIVFNEASLLWIVNMKAACNQDKIKAAITQEPAKKRKRTNTSIKLAKNPSSPGFKMAVNPKSVIMLPITK